MENSTIPTTAVTEYPKPVAIAAPAIPTALSPAPEPSDPLPGTVWLRFSNADKKSIMACCFRYHWMMGRILVVVVQAYICLSVFVQQFSDWTGLSEPIFYG